MTFAGMTAPYSILLLQVLLLLLCVSSRCNGDGALTHNITAILADSSDFSEFSAALAAANLTGKIDRHATITVLAVDDAAMSRLRARRLTPESLGRVLSLHVLLDYFGDAKLKALNGTTQAASLFQDSGAAPGGSGMVGISSVAVAGAGGGRQGVAFSAADAGGHDVFYVKSVKEAPYDIAVLQVSDAMESPSAEGKPLPSSPAPVAAPAPSPATAPAPSPAAAPSSKNQTAPPPQPAAGPSPKNQTAPAPPPKPAVAPSSPRNHTAPPPKPAGGPPAPAPAAPADAPDADDPPPADETGQHNDGADGTVAPWSVFAAVAAVVLLLW